MNIKEVIFIKREIEQILEETNAQNISKVKKIFETSKKLYNEIRFASYYDIQEHNQYFLYFDDISLLRNIEDFDQEYFVVSLSSYHRERFGNFLLQRQHGEILVITKAEADKLLKRSKLRSFKNEKE